MSDQVPGAKRRIGGELVIPAIAVAFTLYFFTTIWDSPWTAQVSAFMIGGVLLLVCGIFFVRAVTELAQGRASLSVADLVSGDDFKTGRIWLFATTFGFCALIDYGGFTLTTFLFLLISMAALSGGRKLGLITVISAIMALGGWAVFIWAFDTRFPRGIFEDFMVQVLGNG